MLKRAVLALCVAKARCYLFLASFASSEGRNHGVAPGKIPDLRQQNIVSVLLDLDNVLADSVLAPYNLKHN